MVEIRQTRPLRYFFVDCPELSTTDAWCSAAPSSSCSCTADGSPPSGVSQAPTAVFDQQHSHHRKLTLNVGGRANLYQGTSIKVKCPVRNFAKNKIEWTKDGKKIVNSAHIKVSSNGALRIFHARMEDAGVYACFAGGIQGNVTLTFKHREDLREERENESRTMLDKAAQDDSSKDTPTSVDHQLVQKVLMSLRRNGEMRMFDKLSSVREPGNLKVDFAIGEWSKCSQKECGRSDGAQVRQLKCRVLFDGMTGYLDDDVCESFGVIRPPSSRSCGPSYCPHWEATEWSECSTSRCIRHATSMQKRDVKCIYENGTDADFALCDRGNRPKVKKECVNMNCTAEWRPSVWGQCSRTCGDGGVQMRLLRCVWRGTRKAAGRHCETSKRPSAIRSCVQQHPLPPCHSTPPTGGIAPFKGWENWRGWRLYNWNQHHLYRARCSSLPVPAISRHSFSDAQTSAEDTNCIDKSRYCEILKLFHA
ncbi:unnamed protein product [Toxocara canis]|uniref:Ig-like domain-containing protein n=1 Tax=Toxocara canis TaxID=6265 RepID=A0A183TYQ9_TOXCA|nr:unnamed protein product [Toxocara canis]